MIFPLMVAIFASAPIASQNTTDKHPVDVKREWILKNQAQQQELNAAQKVVRN